MSSAAAAVLQQAVAWHEAGAGAVLATIVEAWPTAPLRAGSQMAVAGDGRCSGSVFDSARDAEVARAALEAVAAGADRVLALTIDDASASAAGLACGGALRIRLEPLRAGPEGNLQALGDALAAIRERRSVVLCTGLSDGRRRLIAPGAPGGTSPAPDGWIDEALRRARADQTGIAPVDGQELLFQVFNAPLRLYLVGAVKLAQAVLDAARPIGFEVSVIDPRADRMQALSFPHAQLLLDDAGSALRAARLDQRCAVLLLSHSPEVDDPGVIEALASTAFYVGALGSRRTHAQRLERLQAAGIAASAAARIHGPAGLAIGAVGPAEIAASIVAEIIAVLRGGAAAIRAG